MNPTAQILSCVRGAIADPLALVGKSKGEGAASWGILDEHRQLVQVVQKQEQEQEKGSNKVDHSHDHEHEHEHAHAHSECVAVDCQDPTHDHSHDGEHRHDHSHSSACQDSTCTDPSHDHEHSHGHGHDHGAPCQDSTCTDPTHNHDHSHSHSHSEATTAAERFGITSFVYKRRKPFHPIRFTKFLQGLGRLSVDGIAEISSTQVPSTAESASELGRAKRALLRSKGFVWMATSGAAAYFMSHAGQFLDLVVLGRWWADIDRKEWPDGLEDEIMLDFDSKDSKYGDRRQELVFIGQFGEADGGVGAMNSKRALEDVLDSCLLTDEELNDYDRIAKKGDGALREHFVK